MARVEVVLVRPESPANVGAAARAVRNAGLHGLVIVEPGDWRTVECWRTAWGAHDVLEQARVAPDLASAVAGAGYVAYTSLVDIFDVDPATGLPWTSATVNAAQPELRLNHRQPAGAERPGAVRLRQHRLEQVKTGSHRDCNLLYTQFRAEVNRETESLLLSFR